MLLGERGSETTTMTFCEFYAVCMISLLSLPGIMEDLGLVEKNRDDASE